MKPKMLAPPQIQRPLIQTAIELAADNLDGEIDSHEISGWDDAPFYQHLHDCGYKRRNCKFYTSLSLTYVNGACRWHDDPGFGVVACWLLHSDNDFSNDAQLITRYGPLDMRVGDLCVFDADQGHAWLSNGICVMVMATVRQ